jgi:hypothetical protein
MKKEQAGVQVQKGFFKRLFSYFTAKRYEKIQNINQKYLKDWEKVKWRYRVGKLFFIFGFYYFGKQLFFTKVIKINEIENELNTQKDKLITQLENNQGQNFEESMKNITKGLSNFFDFKIFSRVDEDVLNTNKDIKLIYKIVQSLIENENQLNIRQYNGIDIVKLLKFVRINKKYTSVDKNKKKSEEPNNNDVILKVEETYKCFLNGVFSPNQYILYSTNIVNEFSKLDEVAFLTTLNIFKFINANESREYLKQQISRFLNQIIKKNIENYNGFYREDIKLLLNDLEKTAETFQVAQVIL